MQGREQPCSFLLYGTQTMGWPHSALLYGASTLFTQKQTSFYWLDTDKVNLAANVQIGTLSAESYLHDKWGKGGAIRTLSVEPYLPCTNGDTPFNGLNQNLDSFT